MNSQGFDYNKLLKEAKIRWLKPAEIQYILQNHEKYPIAQSAPQQPPSGSVFLFNKRVHRNFRKDGHSWRKKKDGKNVGEAHEKLKVGNVDALNCYYAHGDQNPFFQRRIYWMLDPAYVHIVLVHYREVSEGRFLYASTSFMPTESGSTSNQDTSVNNVHYQGITSGTSELCDPSCSSGTVEEVSSEYVIGSGEMDDHLHTTDRSGNSTYAPRPEVNQALRKLAEQLSLEDYDNSIFFGEKLPAYSSEYEKSQDKGILDNGTREISQEASENILNGSKFLEQGRIEFGKQDTGGNMKQATQSLGSGYGVERTFPSWNQMLEISSSPEGINAHGKTSNVLASTGVTESISKTSALGEDFPARNMLMHDLPSIYKEREKTSVIPFDLSEQFAWQPIDSGIYNADNSPSKPQVPESDLTLQLSAARQFLLGSDNPIDSPISSSQILEAKLPCISGNRNCEANSNAVNHRDENNIQWIGSTDLHGPNNTYSSDFQGMWFDQDHFGVTVGADSGLTVAQKQRFSIREISPEWAFSSESTKVIITGDFLCDPSEWPWAVMFGDTEVPAEIVQQGVFRCHAPLHDAGNVQICITSGNRESCSEVREFEFVSKPTSSGFAGTLPKTNTVSCVEEQLLLVRLVHMLLYGSDGLPTIKGSNKTESGQSGTSKTGDRWSEITEALLVYSEVPSGTIDWIMHELLKDKLQQSLSSRYQGSEERVCLPSKQEQGIIHMISGLGYDWALNPILDSGVSINFRDANGWTALHWAARIFLQGRNGCCTSCCWCIS
ncbi:calmodulin-binding transcription activator 4-like isoform X2 [Iris pallida]|uniref:Calmodulin-binding transcription activator 4-like isoform X2 n=1 Tax=Iris pallida TaxID=29817 RepID=A0AAX6IIJ6_IRIPA|nr:calmodulin-binding transcription activator 4-like isoform X2 [Iris pallida]